MQNSHGLSLNMQINVPVAYRSSYFTHRIETKVNRRSLEEITHASGQEQARDLSLSVRHVLIFT